jgi:hypothetical protein
VKTACRFSTLACRVAIVAGCLLGVAGCRGEHSPGEDHRRDADHVGHVIPAHKPKTFPDAVDRLRELNDEIARGAVKGQPAAAPHAETLGFALDIANWLPEIAAESDMPEKPWNEVNARSAALVADYQMILSGTAADASSIAVHDAGRAISDLEALLAAADPRWFAGPEKRGQAP